MNFQNVFLIMKLEKSRSLTILSETDFQISKKKLLNGAGQKLFTNQSAEILTKKVNLMSELRKL